MTNAILSIIGDETERFEDALSTLDCTYEVYLEVDELGYYTEARVGIDLPMDDAMDVIHDVMSDFGLSISGEWSEAAR